MGIFIREQDTTSALTIAQRLETDVVYVPGLAMEGPVKVPTLCRNVQEFLNTFGNPIVFSSNQNYPLGFPTEAIPSTPFKKSGDEDPSYVYAMELLVAGIPVVYERLNTNTTTDCTVANVYNTLISRYAPANFVSASASCPFELNVDYKTFTKNVSQTTIDVTMYSNGTINQEYEGEVSRTFTAEQLGLTASLNKNKFSDYTSGVAYDAGACVCNVIDGVKRFFVLPVGSGDISAVENTSWAAVSSYFSELYDNIANLYDWIASTIPSGAEDDGLQITFTTYTFSDISDRGSYNIKYITSGGYPTFEFNSNAISKMMAKLASTRGDCIALIDHTNNSARPLVGPDSVYEHVKANPIVNTDAVFAAMFTPYCTYNLQGIYANRPNLTKCDLPASFAYLSCIARAGMTNTPTYLAMAGVTRGRVPNINKVNLDRVLSNAIAEGYQPEDGVAINPITNINPYGQCIWANRTLVNNATYKVQPGLSALSFLDIRNMCCFIKKNIYNVCQSLMFEHNTDMLWTSFLSKVTPFMDGLQANGALTSYRVIRTNKVGPSHKISAVVRVYPTYAVESFDITLQISDTDVDVQ